MKKSLFFAITLLALFTWVFAGCGSSGSTPSTTGNGSNTAGGSPGSSNPGGSNPSGSAGGGTGGSGGGGGGSGATSEIALVEDYSMSGSPAPTAGVELFTVNTTTGALPQNFAGATIGPSGSAAINPAGTFLVTAGFIITAYATHGIGLLTQASTLSNNAAGTDTALFNSTSNFLYTGGFFGGIGAFSLDSSGKLAAVNGSPFTPGGVLLGTGPSGKFLYVLSAANPANDPFSTQSINVFSVDPSTGALTLVPGGTTSVPSIGHNTGNPSQRAIASAFSHSGQLLFLGDHTTGTVHGFTLNLNSGTASQAGTAVAGTAPPTAMTLSLDDSRLYVAGQQDIFGFNVAANGTLTPLNGGNSLATIPSNVAQGSGPPLFTTPVDLQIDLTGRFLYVLTPDELFVYNLDQGTGALSPDSGSNLVRPQAPTAGRPWGELNFGNLKQ